MAHLQFGKALKPASELVKSCEYLGTGLPGLDRLLSGGFIRGEIAEIVGAVSAGRTSLAIATLGQAAARGEVVAYIDTYGMVDPFSASQAGLDLARLLWVRCDGSAEKAMAAADILIRGGGFGMIVLDLTGPDNGQSPAKRHSHTWFRLKQTLEGTRTVFLVLNPSPVSGSLASLVLGLSRREGRWIRMRNGECGMRNKREGDSGMRNGECGMRNKREGDSGMRNGECGMGDIEQEECGVRNAETGASRASADVLPFSLLRIPHSAFRTPHSARTRATLFQGMVCEAQVLKGKSHGSATFYCSFHD